MPFRKESRKRDPEPYLRKVHYYETDKMGIVHHSNYIRWFEEARLAYMKRSGISYAEMEKQGVMIPVVSVSGTFRVAIKFDQTVEIDAWLSVFNGVRMTFQYEVYSEGGGRLLACGQSEHCFIDEQSRKPLNLKKRLPEYYERGMQLLKAK